jgi:hypothetical protein
MQQGSSWVIGETVPWSVSWSGEQKFRLVPSRVEAGKLEVDQIERPGDGFPIFAVNHTGRNRRGLVQLLCHVCGRPTSAGDRWIFPAQTGAMVTLWDGGRGYGLNVPPVHRACAERSAIQCPHLSRQLAEPFPMGVDEGRLIWRTDVTPGLEALARQAPQGVEVVWSAYRLFGPEFTAAVAALRSD